MLLVKVVLACLNRHKVICQNNKWYRNFVKRNTRESLPLFLLQFYEINL